LFVCFGIKERDELFNAKNKEEGIKAKRNKIVNKEETERRGGY